ncbi:MAG: signal peptidase I [Chloroflexi bacterium]|nr:signal peptidase I [Chloroflexota bacterium]
MNQTMASAEPAQPAKSWLREFLEALIPALIIVFIINAFIAQATRVEGDSMLPNIHNNERLIIEKISYYLHSPARRDIIVIKPLQPGTEPLIKRVIGLPGETIAVHDGKVYINDQPLDEPYLVQQTYGLMSPQLIPEGYVFVMGDNRSASNDSRSFGPVPMQDIIGRAWLRYWPFSTAQLINHE